MQKRKTVASDLVENRRMDIRNLEGSREIQELRNKEILAEIAVGRSDSLEKDRVIPASQRESV